MGKHSRGNSRGSDVCWFWGVDGQIITDSTYLWIAREWVEPVADVDVPAPRRALLADITGLHIYGEEFDEISVQLSVAGAQECDLSLVTPPDTVRFQSDEFERFLAWMDDNDVGVGGDGPAAESPSDGEAGCREDTAVPPARWNEMMLAALDIREGIATRDELCHAVAVAARATDHYRTALERAIDSCGTQVGVHWTWFEDVRIAIGTHTAAQRIRSVPLRRIFDDAAESAGNPAVEANVHENVSKRLRMLLTSARYSELIEHLGLEVHTPARVRRSQGRRRGAWKPARPKPSTAESSSTDSQEHRADAVVPQRSEGLPATARVGAKLRVFLDFEGFRTVAVFDPFSDGIRVTKGELKGRSFTDPTAAAAAVIEWVAPGTPEPDDGWALWRLHDRSTMPLADYVKR